jgi:hypothetical protein
VKAAPGGFVKSADSTCLKVAVAYTVSYLSFRNTVLPMRK